MESCTTFLVGGREYALPSRFVAGCAETPPLSPVPLAPDSVAGVTEWGGRLVPCFDAARLLEPGSPGASARAAIFLGPAGSAPFGLLVEAVTGVRLDPRGWRALPPPSEGPVQAVYEVNGRTLHYLDASRLLPPSERSALPPSPPMEAAPPAAGTAVPELRLLVRAGGRRWSIDPASAGPYLDSSGFEPLRHRGGRVIGTFPHGRRRLPVVAPREGKVPEEPAGVLVFQAPGWLGALLLDEPPEFAPPGAGTVLDPAAILSRDEVKRMNRISRLKNWRLERSPSSPEPVPGELHLVCAASGREVVLAAADVERVLEPTGVVPVPDPSGRLAGLVEAEGRTWPAVDLERIFRGPARKEARSPRPAVVLGDCAFRIDSISLLAWLGPGDFLETGGPLPGLAPRAVRAWVRLADPARLAPVLHARYLVERLAEERKKGRD